MAFLPGTVPDETAFTAGASPFTPIGGVWNDALAALTTGQAGELRITEKRAAHVNLRNETGTEIGTAGAPVRIDPTGSTTQPVSGTVTVSGTIAENLTQVAGTAVDVNSGNKSAGTLRVVLATDQPTLSNAQPVTEASLDATIGTPGSAAPAKAIETAGTDGTNLRTILTDTTGRQKVLLYDAAGNAITSTASALDVNLKTSSITLPISAASLPLPTGAATSAKQPALGTAGSPSTDVISVQGVSGGTPQPENLTQLAGTAIDVNSGTKSAGTQRVVLATDQPRVSVLPLFQTRTYQIPINGSIPTSLSWTTILTGANYFVVQAIWITGDQQCTIAASGGFFSVVLRENGVVQFFDSSTIRLASTSSPVTQPTPPIYITAPILYTSTSSGSTLQWAWSGSSSSTLNGFFNLFVVASIVPNQVTS